MVLLYGAGDRLRPVRVLLSPPEGVPGRGSARPDSLRIMRLEEFDYRLPKERVAQEPCARRDAARLMVLDRRGGEVVETTFARIGDHLRAGDLLVLNDTRVFPALLRARSRPEAWSSSCFWRASQRTRNGVPGAAWPRPRAVCARERVFWSRRASRRSSWGRLRTAGYAYGSRAGTATWRTP